MKMYHNKSHKLMFNFVFVLLLLFCGSAVAQESTLDWPRDIDVPEGKITIYQPQLESFNENKLEARAAISITPAGENEPVFGAVWFSARASTDRTTRMVTLLDLEVPQVKFPDADPPQIDKLTAILKREIPKWDGSISLDRLLTMLNLVEQEKGAVEELKMEPPKIVIFKNPAVLITIDGQPKLEKIENSNLMRVVNTPFFIVLDLDTNTYYLKGDQDWFNAKDINQTWQKINNPPASVLSAWTTLASPEQQQTQERSSFDKMPQILVSTEPAELIVIDGEPQYVSIAGTDLLYVDNTESDVFMHIDTQLHFILLSGRWYASTKLFDGHWSYVASDKLPQNFAKIPPGSDKGHVLSQVKGTNESKEAVLETYIPQTATVNRQEAKVAVVYDGDPKFVQIQDTDMSYAENTSYSVIKYGSKYYCCHDAIWFESDSPLGPWIVCVAVPQVIYTIPPNCPVYNVKYVYVYDYTPQVVYVGYTPGYVGCYVYGGTVVYGTGYYYSGWYGRVYYPRPATYGFAVRYNPHTGNWGFRFGYRSGGGWFVGGGYRSGWWGAGGWRGGYRDVDIDINRNINIDNSRNIYNRRSDTRSPRRDTRGPAGDRGPRDQRGPADASRPARTQPARTPEQRNNVYADRNGNVHRRTENGWQQRTNQGWSQQRPSTSGGVSRPTTPSVSRPSTPSASRPSTTRPGTSNLDRQHQARQRGTTRTQNFQRSRGGSRPAGGRGGRRR
ncbi:MAG: carbohydrate-binding family V/XII [Planctomycetota bacterium]|jgi:hypothetical protein